MQNLRIPNELLDPPSCVTILCFNIYIYYIYIYIYIYYKYIIYIYIYVLALLSKAVLGFYTKDSYFTPKYSLKYSLLLSLVRKHFGDFV